MRICGEYDCKMNEKGYVDSFFGYISMSTEELYRYLCDDYNTNITLIAWLPSIKEIEVLYYDRLKISFHITGEQITLYDEDIAKYLIECIRKSYKE